MLSPRPLPKIKMNECNTYAQSNSDLRNSRPVVERRMRQAAELNTERQSAAEDEQPDGALIVEAVCKVEDRGNKPNALP